MEKKVLVDDEDVSVASKTDTKMKESKFPVLTCFAATFLVVGSLCLMVYLWLQITNSRDCVGPLQHEYSTGNVYVSSPKGVNEPSYFGKLGLDLHGWYLERKRIKNGFEYVWANGVTLRIKIDNNFCTSIEWENLSKSMNSYPIDCFTLKGYNWFGGGELYNQVWPLEGAEVDFAPYYPKDIIEEYYYKHPAFGPVLGRYWITSNGMAILVNETSPLIVSINSHQNNSLCLSINPTQYPASIQPTLQYKVCKAENVKTIHLAMLDAFFKKPSHAPDLRMMQEPIWSTWVQYHSEVTQNDVEEFLHNIVSNNFSCSQIEIDDRYSTAHGDFDFDPVKFPNPDQLITDIHKSGCRVTTWVHPFANVDSKAYDEGKANSYFVVGPDGESPGLIEWWNGIAGAVDFTNNNAYNWYLTRLKTFQAKYNIDSFKFDGGSTSYLPYQYQLNATEAMPSNYSVSFATLASQINDFVEVRVGDNSQDLPVFVRFLDRDPTWSSPMGLQSVIPTVLTFGILGYPFILPDMIGGNGSPDKELFVRWLQLNAFLPIMQFSLAPWDFDNETIAIAHSMMKVRENIFPTIVDGVKNAVTTGEPIIRPLWWVAPNDPIALKMNQQFMITDVYLVAPVTQSNASSISVYLPEGKWMEQFGKMVVHTISAGEYITYPVILSDIFYFKNLTALEQYNLI